MNIGEFRASDVSVGGVDDLEIYDSDDGLDEEAVSMFCSQVSCEFLLQLAQNVVTGVLPLGDRIRGTTHPGVGQD